MNGTMHKVMRNEIGFTRKLNILTTLNIGSVIGSLAIGLLKEIPVITMIKIPSLINPVLLGNGGGL